MYLGQKNMKLPEELEKYSSCNSKWIYIILKVIFKRRYLKKRKFSFIVLLDMYDIGYNPNVSV